MSRNEMETEPGGIDERLLVRYLQGDLPEEDQVRVEDRAFTDPEYCGALEAAEADLIDSYVRGELAPADRRRFEQRFLAAPERRKKVEFARTLAELTAESAVPTIEARAPVSAWTALLDALRAWNPAQQFAAGLAALLCTAGVTWLAFDHAAMRSRIAGLETQRRGLESGQADLRRQLDAEQERSRALAAQGQKNAGAVVEPRLALLVFPPGLSRAGPGALEVVLDASTQLARLEIELEDGDNYPRYRAELRTRGGEDILTRANLTRRRAGEHYAVRLDVPASALAAGGYELALKGVVGDSAQDIGYYYFNVLKK